jgi:hypothetical protein
VNRFVTHDLSLLATVTFAFIPARRLHESRESACGGPFDDYQEDPNSVFMHLRLKLG